MWAPASLLLLLTIGLAPVSEEQGYPQTLSELEAVVANFASRDRQASIETLERVLDAVGRHPEAVSEDHAVSEMTLRGWVILAGLHLAEGDEVAASDVMDEAIRTARSQALPVREYGPKVDQLYKERKTALQATGVAKIEVDCEVACEIVINERLLPNPSEEVFLGVYRVWVKATEGDATWEFHAVELTTAGTVKTIVYEAPAPGPKDPAPKPEPKLERGPKQLADTPAKPKRMLPRGAEIAGLAVGVGVMIAGAVLLSFNGKCDISNQRPTADTTPEECGNVFGSTASGAALLGVGGGVLFVSGVLLGIDEVRVGRQRGQQVTLGVSLRF